MAWIELHQSVWTHRKTLMLGHALGLPPAYAAAHMMQLWCWALDNAQDGDLTGLPPAVVAAGAGWAGDPDLFVEAAVTVGYLDRDGDSLRIHDWHDYAGKLIERREQQRERMRQARSRALASRAHNVSGKAQEREQLPNRTEPNHTVPGEEGEAGGAPPGEQPDNAPVNWMFWYHKRTTRHPTAKEIADADALIEKGVTHELIIAMIERAIELKRSAPAAWALKRIADLQPYNIRTVDDLCRFEAEQQRQNRSRDAPKREEPRGFDALMAIIGGGSA